MNLQSPQKEMYAKDQLSALQAQRLAEEIAFGPIIFQVSRLMVKWGILDMLNESKKGLTLDEIVEKTNISRYGIQCLLESSLTIGTILLNDGRFTISKTGWFLLNNPMTRVNMDFNHDVNYLGMYDLEAAIKEGRPAGLKALGNWPTIYEGLSQLPEEASKSWFAFDHYYSDCSFGDALPIVFQEGRKNLLDVGGNTGRFATECVKYREDIEVTILDLPQQIGLMKENTKEVIGKERIHGIGANLLDRKTSFPTGFDAIWMSQFLDCFSEEEVISILSRAAQSMSSETRLFIMETFWDRQRFETASFCLAQISLYFTAMANGNSKMYHSEDMFRCIQAAGLTVETIHDGLGQGHSIVVCKKSTPA